MASLAASFLAAAAQCPAAAVSKPASPHASSLLSAAASAAGASFSAATLGPPCPVSHSASFAEADLGNPAVEGRGPALSSGGGALGRVGRKARKVSPLGCSAHIAAPSTSPVVSPPSGSLKHKGLAAAMQCAARAAGGSRPKASEEEEDKSATAKKTGSKAIQMAGYSAITFPSSHEARSFSESALFEDSLFDSMFDGSESGEDCHAPWGDDPVTDADMSSPSLDSASDSFWAETDDLFSNATADTWNLPFGVDGDTADGLFKAQGLASDSSDVCLWPAGSMRGAPLSVSGGAGAVGHSSVLGLSLKKTPSLLDLISLTLQEGNEEEMEAEGRQAERGGRGDAGGAWKQESGEKDRDRAHMETHQHRTSPPPVTSSWARVERGTAGLEETVKQGKACARTAAPVLLPQRYRSNLQPKSPHSSTGPWPGALWKGVALGDPPPSLAAPTFVPLSGEAMAWSMGVAGVFPAQARPHRETVGPLGGLASDIGEKLKASNFPATSIQIGAWLHPSKYEGDLVAKCYYAKRKLVWELLDCSMGLKSKMEIQWADISFLRASCPDSQPGILEIEMSRPPTFFREVNPQPRKHTMWQPTSDFTGGQAQNCRRHVLVFPAGILGKHFQKLVNSDPRLKTLVDASLPSGSPFVHFPSLASAQCPPPLLMPPMFAMAPPPNASLFPSPRHLKEEKKVAQGPAFHPLASHMAPPSSAAAQYHFPHPGAGSASLPIPCGPPGMGPMAYPGFYPGIYPRFAPHVPMGNISSAGSVVPQGRGPKGIKGSQKSCAAPKSVASASGAMKDWPSASLLLDTSKVQVGGSPQGILLPEGIILQPRVNQKACGVEDKMKDASEGAPVSGGHAACVLPAFRETQYKDSSAPLRLPREPGASAQSWVEGRGTALTEERDRALRGVTPSVMDLTSPSSILKFQRPQKSQHRAGTDPAVGFSSHGLVPSPSGMSREASRPTEGTVPGLTAARVGLVWGGRRLVKESGTARIKSLLHLQNV